MRLKPEHHRIIYFAGLLLIATGLPLSRALMSIGLAVLMVNWLWEGDLKAKWKRFTGIPAAWLFASIFLLHVLGLAWTSDFEYALKDLKTKLPFLLLPLVMASSGPLSAQRYRVLEWLFIGAVLVGTLISTAVYLGFTWHEVDDIRQISLFISHIRFSLLIAVVVFLLLRHVMLYETPAWLKLVCSLTTAWLLVFLVLLESFTGLEVLGVVGYILFFRMVVQHHKNGVRWAGGLLLIALPLVFCAYVAHEVQSFLPTNEPPMSELEAYTPRGEGYWHSIERLTVEDGRYVFRYVAPYELEAAWNARSTMPLNGLDKTGNDLQTTLARFLTSKNLRKDLDGVNALTPEEILAIESGIANQRFLHNNAFSNRIYKVVRQGYAYAIGLNPSGNSVSQRLEFWKTGWWIGKQHWLMGVGTGDVPQAFNDAYIATNSPLAEKYRHRAHNQYLTMFIAFGILGLGWFVFALLLPPMLEGRLFDYRFFTAFTIALLSMLHEDTIESQAGVTFVVFLYCLFLWGRPRTRIG